ncbi:acyl-CoA carboxylase subunit beta [Acrocarpospora catenulata]|uniref:acyl-CoA carboxylase subunit beta n=1 Tax=Acrocarpospora catenulata TaxID=2836182 RepID=UPI001BD99396|nr:carboxyl transferase domain-containing protein [Acrocarpospora catenulata]
MTLPTLAVVHRDESSLDHRVPAVRMARLVDPDSLEIIHQREGVGVVVAYGRVNGARVVVYCTDATLKGGAIGIDECPVIANAIDLAVHERCPVIGVWHSGGAKLGEGVAAMHGIGVMFAAMVRASGEIPQLSVVLGPAAGGAAYGPALTDIVIMSDAARMFVTGPDVVRSVTGEQIDMESLGGPDAHGRKSGVAHIAAGSEEAAFARARQLVTLLAKPGFVDVDSVREEKPLRHLLPDSPRRAYDVRPLVKAILDEEHGFIELQPKWAPNVVIGFGRLAGRTVGVIANNPLRKGGCLDSLSSDKASRFVRMCDSFGVPLLVLVDVPGYLPGVGQEWEGVVRRGAKLLHAFAEASVPRVTLVTRKSYGGAYIAMNSRSLGATAVFAWPEAEVAIMGAKAAVEILHRKQLAAVAPHEREELLNRLAVEHERNAGGVARAVSEGVVDDVIDPEWTRLRLGEALAAAPARRGRHTNIPL